MIGRNAGMIAAFALSVSASAHNPPDIVAEAAAAIVAHDAEALSSMRFRAFDFEFKPLSIKALLDEVQECSIIPQHERGSFSLAHEIHYECPDRSKPKIRCASETVIVF
ncbi:MAG: hypothetical protein AAGL10_13255 [Pseudomonadota bacterium]